MNLGLRYDLDPTLRLNDFYTKALADPTLAGLSAFVSGDRGTDTNNLQPRVGATFDLRGDGTLVLRGGWGMYVTRNRPWFQVAVDESNRRHRSLIEDRDRLRLYPDVQAVTAGVAPRQLGTVIPDDFVKSYALNTTVGAGWQVGRVHVDRCGLHPLVRRTAIRDDRSQSARQRADRCHQPATAAAVRSGGDARELSREAGTTRSSRSSARGLPRRAHLQVSYTLSRTYLDGVDHFLNERGTQRTPQERGYSPSDQRHNLTAAVSASFLARFRCLAFSN